ncbi:MAG: HAMP domain-containing sensor histidine kinase [Actinomycetaceae bacterium]|nr:HAMP domain-containing sensor histidine kinase [Actinomycetaceae bacterium]MDU0970439.1 HAMP domain-containing sensor histidine kinase [Actinomycetaceae bacterium]
MPRIRPQRLTWRLPLIVVAVTTVVIAIVALLAGATISHVLTSSVDERLHEAAAHVRLTSPGAGLPGDAGSTTLGPQGDGEGATAGGDSPTLGGDQAGDAGGQAAEGDGRPPHGAPDSLERPGANAGTIHVVVTPDGVWAGRLTRTLEVDPLSLTQARALQRAATAQPTTQSVPHLGKYRVLRTTRGDATVIVALPLSERDAMLRTFALWGAVYAVLALAVAWVVARWRTRAALAPLAEVTRTAAAVSGHDLTRGAEVPARVDAAIAESDSEAGDVARALNVAFDHIEQALRERTDTEASLAQFVADASHELRTPIATISGYAQLLSRPDLDADEAAQAISRIRSESTRMSALVNNLLMLARLDAGAGVDMTLVPLTGLVVDAVADAGIRAPDHPITLDLHPDAMDAQVMGDEDKLRQVFANLLSNACQHTPAGTAIDVRMYRLFAEGGDRWGVDVADHGPGIPEAVRDTLFDRFTRADTARSRSESAGLGLAIAHTIVAALGGELTVASDESGATFTVTLPVAEDAPALPR